MTDKLLPAGRDDGVPPINWGGGGGNNDNDGGTDGNGNNRNGNRISREEASRIVNFVEEERMAEMHDLGKGASCLFFLMVGLADHLFIKNNSL